MANNTRQSLTPPQLLTPQHSCHIRAGPGNPFMVSEELILPSTGRAHLGELRSLSPKGLGIPVDIAPGASFRVHVLLGLSGH